MTFVLYFMAISFLGHAQPVLEHAIFLRDAIDKNKQVRVDQLVSVRRSFLEAERQLSLLKDRTLPDLIAIEQQEKIVGAQRQFLLDSLATILNQYGLYNSRTEEAVFSQNPFLKDLLRGGKLESGSTPQLNIPSALNAIGGLDVSTLAVGITDFLVERTKTELNTAFFKRMNDELNDDKYKALQALFPATVKILGVIGNEIYQYDLYLNSLRSAFEKDLNGLVNHVPEVVRLNRLKLNSIDSSIAPSIILSLEMAKWMRQGKHPGEVLKLLSESVLDARTIGSPGSSYFSNSATSILLTSVLFSESLRSSEENQYWLKPESIREMLNDDVTLRIYMGLIYQQCITSPYNRIQFKQGNADVQFHQILYHIGENWDADATLRSDVKFLISEFSRKTNELHTSVTALKNLLNDLENKKVTVSERNRLVFNESYGVFNSMIQLVNTSRNLTDFSISGGIITIPSQADRLMDYMEQSGELAYQLSSKQYAGAISNAALLLSDVLKNDPQLNKFLKYGSFMALLLEAETPEQVKAAISAVALPPGSYSIKRHSNFNVAINGYVGAFGGWEIIDGQNRQNNSPNNIAVSAPIGVYFGWGDIGGKGKCCKKCKNPWSLGFSIPIIDLGAIASYRFSGGDKLEEVPTIQLQHIIAPGAFFEVGIAGTPLTLGAGYQVGPRLRNIKEGEQSNNIGTIYHRVGISLKVDIPIINLYGSPKRTK